MDIELSVPDQYRGYRLDKALALLLPDYSRTTIQSWLDAGRILLDEDTPSRRKIVSGGERLRVEIPQPERHDWLAEDIPLDIVFEDDHLLVIDKAPGMVVHPGAGNQCGTLLNALISHADSLSALPRAGIVHRLDKNTSGLLVVAKTETARLALVKQFKNRLAKRQYLAIVDGRLISGGTIDAPIGRHPRNRKKMTAGLGKDAISHYRIVSRYRMHTLLRVSLDTGRTHQIRVHFQHMGHPLVGDPEYGTRTKIPAAADETLVATLKGFRRQALHAETLSVNHPASNEQLKWHAGVPEDMRVLLVALKRDSVQPAIQSGYSKS
ncbi:MAG: 23S rRNA pseudouridine(1911/1915/1917) synthase RluD [Acidiferrobacterales bacterium]|nr:23S rRNA pseudouridine(1911/1915/1917) synthase RluD [Acidiferrobacterales bacterium]